MIILYFVFFIIMFALPGMIPKIKKRKFKPDDLVVCTENCIDVNTWSPLFGKYYIIKKNISNNRVVVYSPYRKNKFHEANLTFVSDIFRKRK